MALALILAKAAVGVDWRKITNMEISAESFALPIG
jgi:hypothetical protein